MPKATPGETTTAPGRSAWRPSKQRRLPSYQLLTSVTEPVTLVAPAAGRFAFEFTVGLDVEATQNTEPSLIGAATPIVRAPAGVPFSRTRVAIVPAFTQVPGAGQVVALVQPSPSLGPPAQ